MKKLILLFVIVLVAIARNASAQEQAIFNHYTLNPSIMNPATTGFDGTSQLFFHFKNQWTGFPGAPKNYAAYFNAPLGEKLGVGVALNTETAAAMSRLRGQINYAFRFRIQDFKMGIGLSTELHHTRLSNGVLNEPYYNNGDPTVEDAVNGATYIDASGGVFASYNDKIYFGLSAKNLIQAKLGALPGGTDGGKNGPLQYYSFNIGYKYKNDVFKLEPSIMVRKIKDAPFQLDANVMTAFMEDKLLIGAAYRAGYGGSLGFLIGTKISGMQFAYSVDYSLSNFQTHAGIANEITLGYTFNNKLNLFDRSERYKN
jgi:type IX secretion system PorP/SprF family membrane protein